MSILKENFQEYLHESECSFLFWLCGSAAVSSSRGTMKNAYGWNDS